MKGKKMKIFVPQDLPAQWKKPKEERTPSDGVQLEGALLPSGVMEEEEEEEEDREEVFLALVEHRRKKLQELRDQIDHYEALHKEAERKLLKAERKLARFRAEAARDLTPDAVTDERPRSRPKLVIPSSANFSSHTPPSAVGPESRKNDSVASQSSATTIYGDPIGHESSITKVELELKEEHDLIQQICSRSSARIFDCKTSSFISSQHRRRLRSLALSTADDTLFATSALDGMVNLWQIKEKGLVANRLSSTDCASRIQKRWPEDMAWSPHGDRIFCSYTADNHDSQVSVIEIDTIHRVNQVTFLDEKPHAKGSINSIAFLLGQRNCFVTGGADHAVILWNEVEGTNSWKSKTLHKFCHSSAVTGVAGMLQKDIVLSSGCDKKIFGFDVQSETQLFTRHMESKCMNVLPNPCDFNLFMVQTGTPESQLRLFDFRMGVTEFRAFGWKQEASDSQSSLISQAWSPDGLFVTSGSADPMIHLFDIRYNAPSPSQSITAHRKRVFKAVWQRSLPLLISISSDLDIGMHQIA
ncbi:hypothetical protein SAY86_026690 [Trapa natans]|uniref:Uncharacterized protein n=1 Tax=Trapa natans TaxID=22666 RepID=A0AAN7KEF0_TRANT|nr:hypothetical protein SAY86_026690 [Trapa natans]